MIYLKPQLIKFAVLRCLSTIFPFESPWLGISQPNMWDDTGGYLNH
jgi:hypothetical protein